MQLQVKTQIRIGRPARDVFEALIDPGMMSRYFISRGSGRLEEEKRIVWTDDSNTELEIKVTRVEKDRLISFLWEATGVETIVEMTLVPQGEATVVKIRENGWNKTNKGIAAFAESMQGWYAFLFCLKAFLEYGIGLCKGGSENLFFHPAS